MFLFAERQSKTTVRNPPQFNPKFLLKAHLGQASLTRLQPRFLFGFARPIRLASLVSAIGVSDKYTPPPSCLYTRLDEEVRCEGNKNRGRKFSACPQNPVLIPLTSL